MMNSLQFFTDGFHALTQKTPFRWQERLFIEHFLRSEIPACLDVPTGLGKTSVITIWLLALAYQAANGRPSLPRRLVYVVNRRTVVDQATDVAEMIRGALCGFAAGGSRGICTEIREQLNILCAQPNDEALPLAISTLRGELADNREWQADPARPTIIIGTVDMIGSRLLFSGYGVSRRMRPFHAGLLGQDTLIVHDEAHLTPAFGKLLLAIRQMQKQQPRPLRVIELSATQRSIGPAECFSLRREEEAEKEVARRLGAPKTLRLHPPVDVSELEKTLLQLALAHAGGRSRVLVYARSPKVAAKVASLIGRRVGSDRVAILTGTIRGYERDELASKPLDSIADLSMRRRAELFRGYRTDPNRALPEKSEYLVCTSAGEVGVDLDADHMICDLSTLDSMIQRLGRVNRLGRASTALIDVVQVLEVKWKDDIDAGVRNAAIADTADALKSLPGVDGGKDASPHALRSLAGRTAAFSATPRVLPLTDILIDNWAMTRVAELPGRPPVERWLHGAEASAPELHVAWRREVGELGAEGSDALTTLFDKHPILPQERLRVNLKDGIGELRKIAGRSQNAQVVLILASGAAQRLPIGKLAEENSERLREGTIVLSPEVGGLDERGMLDGASREPVQDVADDPGAAIVGGGPMRLRVLLTQDAETGVWTALPLSPANLWGTPTVVLEGGNLGGAIRAVRKRLPSPGMAVKARVILAKDDQANPMRALLLLAQPASLDIAQESPAAAASSQNLEEHLEWAQAEAKRVTSALMLTPASADVANAIEVAARWHDRGKNRAAWQRAIGNPPPSEDSKNANEWKPWAKSGERGFDAGACGRYRHEFGSLREAVADSAIIAHPESDLILHLIAAHHGWARPHFEPDQWDTANGTTEEENAAVATGAMRRFARLQRRFGHWGLAWLEALMRSADYAATRRLSTNGSSGSRIGL